MSNPSVTTIEARKQRWRDFLSPDADDGFMFLVNYSSPEQREVTWPKRWPDRKQERIDFALRRYEIAMRQAEWLEDDFVPYLNNRTGTEVFAEAFGCPVYRPDDTMPSARPIVFEPGDVHRVEVPELMDCSLSLLFEIADELTRQAGPDAVPSLVDIQSPMGIVAEMWDKNNMFPSMITAPAAVHELREKVLSLLTAFHDEWISRYGHQYVAHWPDYFMDGGITLSEDEVGSVSTDMFEEFFLPDLVLLSERYGGIGIHCCACARHQWQNFAKVPDLRLINLSQRWNEETDPEYIDDACRFFAPICAQMHDNGIFDGVPESLPRMAPGARVVYRINVDSRDEALRACERMRDMRTSAAN
jgi:hypothetical protein